MLAWHVKGVAYLFVQLAKAQAFVETCAKRHDAEKTKAENISAHQAELAQKALDQETNIAAAARRPAAFKARFPRVIRKISDVAPKVTMRTRRGAMSQFLMLSRNLPAAKGPIDRS